MPSQFLGGAFNCYKMLEVKKDELTKNTDAEEIAEEKIGELKILAEIICNVILREIENSNHEK